jgi:hypothetical protein
MQRVARAPSPAKSSKPTAGTSNQLIFSPIDLA